MSRNAALTRVIVINEQPYLCDRRRTVAENIDDVRECYDVPVMTMRLASHGDYKFACDKETFEIDDLPIALDV